MAGMESPLKELWKELGPELLAAGGMETAACYGEPAEAVARARRAAGVVDLSYRVQCRATGADRIGYLHRIVSCDVQDLKPGDIAGGLFLTARGRVVADFLLGVLPDRVEILAPFEARQALVQGLSKYAIADEVAFEDRAGASALLGVVGPRADEIVRRLREGEGPGEEGPAILETRLAGADAVLIRTRRADFPVRLLLVEAAAAPGVFLAARAAAEAAGGGLLGARGLEMLRVEGGIPRLGAEFGEETLPQEAGLAGHVSFTKGCFLGQEPVARLQNRGHTNRGLAGIRLGAGTPVPAPGSAVRLGEKEVGRITSAVLSATLGVPIALALLRHEAGAPGTAVIVETPEGPNSGVTTSLPFVT